MSEDLTTRPGENESPPSPSHVPGPQQWPDSPSDRDLTEYESPPGREQPPPSAR